MVDIYKNTRSTIWGSGKTGFMEKTKVIKNIPSSETRHNNYLVVPHDEFITLPPRCICCNSGESEYIAPIELIHHSPLIYLFAFISPKIYINIAKKCGTVIAVRLSLCKKHKKINALYSFLKYFIVSLLLVCYSIMYVLSQGNLLVTGKALVPEEFLIVTAFPLLLVIVFILSIPTHPLKIKKTKGGYIYLKGADNSFLNSLNINPYID